MPRDSRPLVTHQAGERHIDALRDTYASAGVVAECLPFIDDIARRYAEADVVVCRSGATTIAELAAVGVASLLVPFPHAADDHQVDNARCSRVAAPPRCGCSATSRRAAGRVAGCAGPRAPAAHGGRGARTAQDRCDAPGRRPLSRARHAMKHKVKHVHFVGIGGAGMSGIAEVLTNRLPGLGLRSRGVPGHAPAGRHGRARRHRSRGGQRRGVRRGRVSTAVAADNPEVVAARERGIPVVRVR